MVDHAIPVPKKKRGGDQTKKRKSDTASSDPSEDRLAYGIDRLNLGEPARDLESDPKLLLTQLS